MGSVLKALSPYEIVVRYDDLSCPGDLSDPGKKYVITVSAMKEFDEAIREAYQFAQEVMRHVGGKVLDIRVFLNDTSIDPIDCPLPGKQVATDATMERFVVAWEAITMDAATYGAPLKFFETNQFCLGVKQARAAAVRFASHIKSQENHHLLYIQGYSNKHWHQLDENGQLLWTSLLLEHAK